MPQPTIGTAIQTIGSRRIVQTCRGTQADDLPDPSFPFNILFVEHHDDFPLHSHQYAELVIVREGAALHVTDAETYPIGPGDVFVINGDLHHGFKEVDNLHLCNIQFEAAAFLQDQDELEHMMGFHALFDLEPRSKQDERFRKRLRLNKSQRIYAESLTRAMEQEFLGDRDGRRTLIRSHFLSLVTHLSRLYAEQKQGSPAPVVRMASVIAHIRKHFQQPIRIEELAKIAHLSPSQFQRTFKRIYRTTPLGFIHGLRIETACDMLKDPSRDIASVAQATGFSTPAFFSTRFRKAMGMSPSAYRKKIFTSSAIQAVGSTLKAS